MSSAFRKVVLVAAASALLSSQAAYAAPATSHAAALDPLVSLSVLGTPQSRAAVCGAGSQCALPSTAMAASATTAAAAQPYDQARGGPGVWPLLLGLGVVIILMAVILSDGGGGSGDLTPVSP